MIVTAQGTPFPRPGPRARLLPCSPGAAVGSDTTDSRCAFLVAARSMMSQQLMENTCCALQVARFDEDPDEDTRAVLSACVALPYQTVMLSPSPLEAGWFRFGEADPSEAVTF
ncbi:hypothetical protein EYF80_035040 [Liparis tanakae]|uniref:Uncharacterized protein n=1 Tax=Liparis tanakae TaxID=230148 RepID=A0A4Z2GMH4_9TELE|nr:hypothetical protein EYF80_035040 [Liparis tanakae]